MKSTNQGNVVSANIVAKSGFWYTISNFMFRGIAFITTPIFVRLLSKSEFGEFNNITSWVSILFVFTACDLYTSIIRAKLDLEDDLDRYSYSILTLGSIITFIFFVLTILFGTYISDFTGIQKQYFYIIYVYLFFIQGYYVFATNARAHYKYKLYSIATGIGIVASCLLSVVLVVYMENKLTARIYGHFIPYIIVGCILYFFVRKQGKEVNISYYKYGASLSFPLVPHLLSLTILSSSDKIMITKYIGVEFTALYSIAAIVSHIVVILIDSMNKAWAPWFLDVLKAKNLEQIKEASRVYFFVFVFLLFTMILIGPEIILILGGEKYKESINVLLPLLLGGLFQFVYTMYIQIEFFEKKMTVISMATICAAVSNIVLNYLFIPVFGYIAAGYTTLIGYILLFIIHFITVRKMGYKNLFDDKIIICTLVISVLITLLISSIYHLTFIRGFIIVSLFVVVIFLLYKFKIQNFYRLK